jgi:hypothetical protein
MVLDILIKKDYNIIIDCQKGQLVPSGEWKPDGYWLQLFKAVQQGLGMGNENGGIGFAVCFPGNKILHGGIERPGNFERFIGAGKVAGPFERIVGVMV